MGNCKEEASGVGGTPAKPAGEWEGCWLSQRIKGPSLKAGWHGQTITQGTVDSEEPAQV